MSYAVIDEIISWYGLRWISVYYNAGVQNPQNVMHSKLGDFFAYTLWFRAECWKCVLGYYTSSVCRDGVIRSSEEVSVMEMEQRDDII